MKVYLEDKNKRKIVYDILNIFIDHDEIIFADEKEAGIKIKDGLVNIFGEDFYFNTNQDLKTILYDFLEDETGYKSP